MKTMKTTIYTKRKLQTTLILLFVIFSQVSFAKSAIMGSPVKDIMVADSSSFVITPVVALSFNVLLGKENVKLNWVTVAEKNISHFIIEKSTDGQYFSNAALVFAFGNTTTPMEYSFVDNMINVDPTILYYRLRTVNNDKTSQLSDVRMIRVVNSKK